MFSKAEKILIALSAQWQVNLAAIHMRRARNVGHSSAVVVGAHADARGATQAFRATANEG
jgi:hypothetical protein